VPKTSNIEAWSKVTPWGENVLPQNRIKTLLKRHM